MNIPKIDNLPREKEIAKGFAILDLNPCVGGFGTVYQSRVFQVPVAVKSTTNFEIGRHELQCTYNLLFFFPFSSMILNFRFFLFHYVVLKRFRHPNIIQAIAFAESTESFNIALEHMSRGFQQCNIFIITILLIEI